MDYHLTVLPPRVHLQPVNFVDEPDVGSDGWCYKRCRTVEDTYERVGDCSEMYLNRFARDWLKVLIAGGITFTGSMIADGEITGWTWASAIFNGLGNGLSCVITPTDFATQDQIKRQARQIAVLKQNQRNLIGPGIRLEQGDPIEPEPGSQRCCYRAFERLENSWDEKGDYFRQRLNRYEHDWLKIEVPGVFSFIGTMLSGKITNDLVGAACLNMLGNCLSTVLSLTDVRQQKLLARQKKELNALQSNQKTLALMSGNNPEVLEFQPDEKIPGSDSRCFRGCLTLAGVWNKTGDFLAQHVNRFVLDFTKAVIVAGGVSTLAGFATGQPRTRAIIISAILNGVGNTVSTLLMPLDYKTQSILALQAREIEALKRNQAFLIAHVNRNAV